jgi:hypothetical protein
LLGEDGVKKVNEHVVKWAVEEKLADPTVAAADTTAQEAAVPYPNEMRLMATFVSAIAAASKNVGSALQGFVKRAGGLFHAAKTKCATDWCRRWRASSRRCRTAWPRS